MKQPDFKNPVRRLCFKMRLDRTEYAVSPEIMTCTVQLEEPGVDREFVVVDECYKMAAGLAQSHVSRQGDVLMRLITIRDPERRSAGKVVYRLFGRLLAIVVGNHDRKCECIFCLLFLKRLKQALQKHGPPKG